MNVQNLNRYVLYYKTGYVHIELPYCPHEFAIFDLNVRQPSVIVQYKLKGGNKNLRPTLKR